MLIFLWMLLFLCIYCFFIYLCVWLCSFWLLLYSICVKFLNVFASRCMSLHLVLSLYEHSHVRSHSFFLSSEVNLLLWCKIICLTTLCSILFPFFTNQHLISFFKNSLFYVSKENPSVSFWNDALVRVRCYLHKIFFLIL